MHSGRVNLRAAVIASVSFRIVFAGLTQSVCRRHEIAQIKTIANVRQSDTGSLVYFVVAIWLGDLVYIVLHWCVLLSRKVQARVDK